MEERNDEIDLMQLFKEIGSWFRNLFVGIYNILFSLFITVLYFVLRNFIPLIILTVVSFVITQIKIGSQYYESRMKIQCNAIDNNTAIDYFNRLRDLVGVNPVFLANKLKIDSTNASLISDINAYWAIDKDGDGVADFFDEEHEYFKAADDSISSRVGSYFFVNVRYKEGLDITKLNTAIENYFNENKFFVKRNELRKKQNRQIEALTVIEQKKLDTIRNIYNEAIVKTFELPETRNGQLVFLNGKETQIKDLRLFHNEVFSLQSKQLSLIKDNELNDNVIKVLERLDLSQKRVRCVRNWVGLFFFIFGVIVLILFENRKKIIELKKEASIK